MLARLRWATAAAPSLAFIVNNPSQRTLKRIPGSSGRFRVRTAQFRLPGRGRRYKRMEDVVAPWWVRYTRWRQTSAVEAVAAEQGLLSLLRVPLSVFNVRVGPGREDYLHTLVAGGAAPPPTASLSPVPAPSCGSRPLPSSAPSAEAGARSVATPSSGQGPSSSLLNSNGNPGMGNPGNQGAVGNGASPDAGGLGASATGQAAGLAWSNPAAQEAAKAASGAELLRSPSEGPPVVLLPGYGACTGFFMRNLEDVARNFRLYAVDWLGTGLSGRPRFKAQSREEAESFFTESLAAWKTNVGLGNEKVVLVGHSLGGYLAACYALRHPEHVQHLVLVCPAGVPKAPEDWQRKILGGISGWRASAFKAAMWAWERGVTPQALVRGLGPWGPRICEGYVLSRFTHRQEVFTPTEVHWFKQYFYHTIAAPGSGEYALRHLLAPGAWAHAPLTKRLQDLKVPVTFIYGADDWMRPQHAVELVQRLQQERPRKVSSDLHVEIIDGAGHFVFLDQPSLFAKALTDALSMYVPGAVTQGVGESVRSHSVDATTWGPAATRVAQGDTAATAAGIP